MPPSKSVSGGPRIVKCHSKMSSWEIAQRVKEVELKGDQSIGETQEKKNWRYLQKKKRNEEGMKMEMESDRGPQREPCQECKRVAKVWANRGAATKGEEGTTGDEKDRGAKEGVLSRWSV